MNIANMALNKFKKDKALHQSSDQVKRLQHHNSPNSQVQTLSQASFPTHSHVTAFEYKDLNITPMFNCSSIESEWNKKACEIIRLAKSLVEIIDEISKVNNPEIEFADLITTEDGSIFKI